MSVKTTMENKFEIEGPSAPSLPKIARLAISGILTGDELDVDGVEDLRLVVSEMVNVALDSEADRIKLRFELSETLINLELFGMNPKRNSENDLANRIFQTLLADFEINQNEDVVTIKGSYFFNR